jgi:hypothetical protein
MPQGRERGAVLAVLVRCLDTRQSQPIIPVRDYSQRRGISDKAVGVPGGERRASEAGCHENGLARASAREMGCQGN